MKRLDPNMDGKDHINVYSGGQTELGRMLTCFCQSIRIYHSNTIMYIGAELCEMFTVNTGG